VQIIKVSEFGMVMTENFGWREFGWRIGERTDDDSRYVSDLRFYV
jgi:hypothetical protein